MKIGQIFKEAQKYLWNGRNYSEGELVFSCSCIRKVMQLMHYNDDSKEILAVIQLYAQEFKPEDCEQGASWFNEENYKDPQAERLHALNAMAIKYADVDLEDLK